MTGLATTQLRLGNPAIRARSAMTEPTVLVVIVNYRTAGLVVDCLHSLRPEIEQNAGSSVIVVDNASGDDSAETLSATIEAERWGGWVALLSAPINGGFAYGNNLAARPALASKHPPDFVWMLNPDTRVRQGALSKLVAFLCAHPHVGIAGSSLEFEDGTLWPHAFRFPSIWSEIATALRLRVVGTMLQRYMPLLNMSDRAERVDWLPGASMMVRREVFESIGLMDEGYFLYFEETDFCLHAARAGWECWYVPQSRVMHIAGQSTGVTGANAATNRRPRYWFESRRRFWIKSHGWLYAAATDLVWTLCFSIWKARSAVQRKPRVDPPFYLRDFLRHSAMFHTSMPASSAAAVTSIAAKNARLDMGVTCRERHGKR